MCDHCSEPHKPGEIPAYDAQAIEAKWQKAWEDANLFAVDEDPVCGSGHCHIVPYWVRRFGKDSITAYQASRRGGTLYCRQAGDRITLAGKAVLYSTAELSVDL